MAQQSIAESGRSLEELEEIMWVELPVSINGTPEAIASQQQYGNDNSTLDPSPSQAAYNEQYQDVIDPGTWGFASPSPSDPLGMAVLQTPQEGTSGPTQSDPVVGPLPDPTVCANSTQSNLDPQTSLLLPEELSDAQWQELMGSLDMIVGGDLPIAAIVSQQQYSDNTGALNPSFSIEARDPLPHLTVGANSAQINFDSQISLPFQGEFGQSQRQDWMGSFGMTFGEDFTTGVIATQQQYGNNTGAFNPAFNPAFMNFDGNFTNGDIATQQQYGNDTGAFNPAFMNFDGGFTVNSQLVGMDTGAQQPYLDYIPRKQSMRPVEQSTQEPFSTPGNSGNVENTLLLAHQPARIPSLPRRQDADETPRVSAQGHVRKPTKGRRGLRSNIESNGGAKAGVAKDELRDLPQPDCWMPNIVLTAAEIHAYFPTILKSPEAMMRFVRNGITVSEQARLINWFHGGVFAEKRLSETLKARKAKFAKVKFGATSRTMAKNRMAIPEDNNYGTGHYSQPFGANPERWASLLERAAMVQIHPSGVDAGGYTRCVLEAIGTNNATLTDEHVAYMMEQRGWRTTSEDGNWDRKSFDRLQALMTANPDA